MAQIEADAGDFIKQINDSEAGQFLSLVSNISGTLGAGAAVISLFQQSDTDRILDAINQLREELERDFRQLGDLIRQQIQLVVDTTNRDAMALALSRSDVALNVLPDFLQNNDTEALETARNESIAGVSFFTELGLDAPDLPYFMPGLIKAATIRLLVISAEPANLHEPFDVIASNVRLMADYIARMIDDIKREVDSKHYIRTFQHTIQCTPLPE
jgi:hypothetical protein